MVGASLSTINGFIILLLFGGRLWRTCEGQALTLRFDEVERQGTRNVIKKKSNMKIEFKGN